MRSYDGQLSENRPIRRTDAEKRRLLTRLEGDLATLPARANPSTRAALEARIKELKGELDARPPRREREREGPPPRERRRHE